MSRESGVDPFDDQRFVDFVEEISQRHVLPANVRELAETIAAAEKRIEAVKTETVQLEEEESEVNSRISAKMMKMSALDERLRALSEMFGRPDEEIVREKVTYMEGAGNINAEEVPAIQEDQNALVLLFRDFQMAPSFVGKKPSQIFLVIDFLEHQSLQTRPVSPSSGMFDSSLTFISKNDFILSAYFEKSAVPVQLCRLREEVVTEIGTGELNLSPLVEDRVLAFTASIQVWSSTGKIVAKITCEAMLSKPLVKK
jgi:hypothetical protein